MNNDTLMTAYMMGKRRLTSIVIIILNLRRSDDHLKCIIGFLIPITLCLFSKIEALVTLTQHLIIYICMLQGAYRLVFANATAYTRDSVMHKCIFILGRFDYVYGSQ